MSKKERPKVVDGHTYKYETGSCGTIYITINGDDDGPMEIFARLGKAGGCSNCQNEALGRAVSLGLKYGIPPEEFVKELGAIRCPSPKIYPKTERIFSCPDAMAQALDAYCEGEWYQKIVEGIEDED